MSIGLNSLSDLGGKAIKVVMRVLEWSSEGLKEKNCVRTNHAFLPLDRLFYVTLFFYFFLLFQNCLL